MGIGERGVVAAGHPLTAQAGARVLREGGNAVAAAVGAMRASFATEPLLADLLPSTPECAALWAPEGHILREGDLLRNPELGEALLRLAQDGPVPFYQGDIAAAVCDWLRVRGGSLTSDDLAGYRAIERE